MLHAAVAEGLSRRVGPAVVAAAQSSMLWLQALGPETVVNGGSQDQLSHCWCCCCLGLQRVQALRPH
jgi:hypothetical protein